MKRVLIADDHTENLYFLEVLLKGNGFAVDSAENGLKALELARYKRPDLVISDILMPVMDGYALCREMKADSVLKDVPFIFYTATFTTAKDEALAINLGADRFVVKPQDPDALMQIINELLSTPREIALERPPAEKELMKEYSEALFRKLEKKMTELEQANRDLRQREIELLAAIEASECAERAKMRFLRIMSHELRTPLNVILGTLQISEYDQSYDPEMTLDAKKAVFSLLDMIDNILEVARLESSTEPFRQKPMKLERIIETLSKLFSETARQKGIGLEFVLSPLLPLEIVADGPHIQQVLWHLINNAIKFTPKGSVRVTISREQLKNTGDATMRIEVHDTGIGIDPEKQHFVFGLFTQADDSDSRMYEGSGIGLALTRRLVELMGGSILLNSQPGFGSTFTLLLPVTVPE